jgi:iron(II)-dependent oxidoreductase
VLSQVEKLDREALADWYRRNRQRSAQLFSLIEPSAYYDHPIPLRHPFAFYEGHLPAFSYLVLNERALGEAPLDPRLEKIFERGIDPASIDDARGHARADWPTKEQIQAFGQRCDERIYAAIANAQLVNQDVPRLVRGQAIYTVLEHEPMHHETLVYLLHQLAPEKKRRAPQTHRDPEAPRNDFIEIAPGTATLGARRDKIPFGWDNEFDEHQVPVSAFAIQRFPVTNGDYREFVAAGGPAPPFWIERDGEFQLRGVFEDLSLPLSWPAYVRHTDSEAYAEWKGARLASEAEYHRAAFGTPQGAERAFPWGEETPAAIHGNFGFERYDPEPVDAHPAGASAWGVYDLIGNGWEWTGTPFAPFAGFEPMASYPQYSADFFDGKHFVMKGASPVTSRELIRRSFRNWFYADYPYMYAKFRLVLER